MPADPLIGQHFGNVKLTGKLGAGAMGVVYRGYHSALSREVAVKLLTAHGDGPNDSYRERFLREGRAAARVRNEHVVQVIDAGQQGNEAYLIMELVNGMSLGSILDEAGTLSPEVVVRLGVGMCLGLAAIHAQQIIHRDIKPDNVLIGNDKKAKIADLGLAKQLDSKDNRLTATGVVVGTPLYLSPEAIRDPGKITAAADIYSLGATFYHMLTGRPPYTGSTAYEVMNGHLAGTYRPIREVRSEVPACLARVVESCLAKQPDRRPTASALADLLINGDAGGDRSMNRGMLATIGAAVVLVVGGAVIGWRLMPRGGGADAGAGSALVTGVLVLRPSHAQVRWRSGQGDWQDWNGNEATLAAGPHEIEVAAIGAGPTPYWRGTITIEPGKSAQVPVALRPVNIAPVRAGVPGVGMLFVDGVSYGLDPALTISQAGRYQVARWDERGWIGGEVAVDLSGRLAETTFTTGQQPNSGAWWRGVGERRCHVLSWWEAERIRSAAKLPAPVGWFSQGQQPEQPAVNLSPALVQAALAAIAAWDATLPERDAGLRLATDLQAALWCTDRGKLDSTAGSNVAMAQLVAVPR